MSPIHDLVLDAKSTGDWSRVTAAIPYARWLGISAAVSEGELVCTMAFSPTRIGNPTIPALHGGTLGGLLESTAAFEVLHAHEAVIFPRIITLTIDYLRSARAVDTYASATLLRRGRRVASVQAFAWQEDRKKPVATAIAHLLIEPPDTQP